MYCLGMHFLHLLTPLGHQDIGRQCCTSPVDDYRLPYDPTRRCAVSAEKLLASAANEVEDEDDELEVLEDEAGDEDE